MADKSTYLSNHLLDHLLGGPDFARPATVYVALFTSAPGAGGGGTEVSGGSYARVAVTNNATNFPAASGASKSNATAITFPAATAGWGSVSHYGLFDALTGGNLLKFAPILVAGVATPRTVASGDQPSFGVGDLVFNES
jgi:hypothetical protein